MNQHATPYPKFSIVTPSFNQTGFIERTIRSVLDQNYPNLEYIVVDGGSTDGTLEILKKYEAHLLLIVEPDEGQAEAINKGFRRSTGEIVGWLNADDEFMPGALEIVAAYFSQHPEAQLLYGDAETIDARGRSYGRRGNVKGTSFKELVGLGDFIVQPAAFWRAGLLAEIGLLDESLVYCLDYEYWLRITQRYQPHYLPLPLARERFHSQAKTIRASLRRIEEIEMVARRYGNPGVPDRFKAEQTAVYFVESLRQASQGNWVKARACWKRAVSGFPPPKLFWAHLAALALGPKGTAFMRLRYDRLRGRFLPKTY